MLPAVELARAASAEDALSVLRNFMPDAVVHTACAYGRRDEQPMAVLDANLRLGIALLQAILAHASAQTVFVNTGTVLAPQVSLYALSKAQFAHWGAELASQHPQQLQFINVHLQQMYGAGDDRSKFTTHVIETCRLGEERLSLTPGEQRRDFIHIDDVVRAYDMILTQGHRFAASDAIDVGSGHAVSMREFVQLVHCLTAAPTQLDFGAVPYRANEAMLCVADTTRLRGMGWAPIFDLESGLKHTLAASMNAPPHSFG